VWLLIGLLCVYSMFLIALSSIASTVLLAIGPLFIVMLLFDSTRRYFEAWIGQLANYALITILTVVVAGLLLHVVQSYAAQTAARGSALLTVDALDMVLMSTLVFLLMRQIMPIAAGLAGGVAIGSFGLVSRGVQWGIGRLRSGALQLAESAGGALSGAGGEGPQARTNPSWRDPP
jgi:type IV secretion system protein VirB6